jgi:hypothetical protein
VCCAVSFSSLDLRTSICWATSRWFSCSFEIFYASSFLLVVLRCQASVCSRFPGEVFPNKISPVSCHSVFWSARPSARPSLKPPLFSFSSSTFSVFDFLCLRCRATRDPARSLWPRDFLIPLFSACELALRLLIPLRRLTAPGSHPQHASTPARGFGPRVSRFHLLSAWHGSLVPIFLVRILVFRCRTRFFVACCSLAGLRQLYLRSASNSACRFACVQSVRGNICKAVLIFCLRVSSYRWMPVSFLSSRIKRLEFF